MVSVAAGPLTRIGFRRDVRIFLTALVGFLALLIVVLLLTLEQFAQQAQASVLRRWSSAADAAAAEVRAIPGGRERQIALESLVSRSGALRIELPAADGALAAGVLPQRRHTIDRRIEDGVLRLHFDASELASIQRRFAITASIATAAALTGVLLLFFYLPRITRPIEQMLEEAQQLGVRGAGQEETAYLIETFRESIQKLKVQESELTRLHEAEKSRADELALVSATLTRSLTSGFIALDAGGRVLEMNGAARETLGIAADTELRRPIAALIGESPLTSAITNALEARQTVSRVELAHETNGTVSTIGLTAVPLVGEEGRFIGMIALFTDLTPIKQLEARIRAMQTLADLGEIAAGIVHEFRNSLSTISGYVRLAGRSPLPEDAAGRLRAAEEEATQLAAAVERLLAFASPMALAIELTDLKPLVDGIVSRLRDISPGVAIEVQGDATAHADPALLGRAVENVLRNAIEAVLPVEEPRIRVRIQSGPPAIVVSDNGPGFPSADASRYLLPFVSDKPGGFGLGLSLARKIAVLHGGDVELQGGTGEGATVTIRLGSA